MFNRVLAPVDFSECSRAALEYALRITHESHGTVVVLHVWEPPSFATPDLLVSRPDTSGMTLLDWVHGEVDRQFESFLALFDLPEDVRLERRLIQGDPAHKILEILETEQFDTVVMGTHGRTGMMRLLMGSVAEKVVRASPAPVLTLRSTDDTRVVPPAEQPEPLIGRYEKRP